jgi:hypothetical protein
MEASASFSVDVLLVQSQVLTTPAFTLPVHCVETTDSGAGTLRFRLKPAHVLGTPSGCRSSIPCCRFAVFIIQRNVSASPWQDDLVTGTLGRASLSVLDIHATLLSIVIVAICCR